MRPALKEQGRIDDRNRANGRHQLDEFTLAT
jgi:hypothetical protein